VVDAADQHRRGLATYKPFVRSQLRRYGASDTDLEDLTQEVWVVALARSPGFSDERATLSWLAQVCRRVAAGERRSRARTPLLASEAEAELPVEAPQAHLMERELDEQESLAALARLSDSQLDVLALYGSGELSMREVADLIGEPERTVYSRYRGALEEVSRSLRRSERVGARTSSVPPPMRSSSIPPGPPPDHEPVADRGELILYRCDAHGVLGRLGNVIVTRWRKRAYEQTSIDLGDTIAKTHERMHMPLVLVNDIDADIKMPDALERRSLRDHIRQHSAQVAMAVDICNSPRTRFFAAIVNGIILVTRANTSFAMVPSLEHARHWVEPRARRADGAALEWERVTRAVLHMREKP
jgi:RNA polymerase sigma-70 factor (ECF subfamily)